MTINRRDFIKANAAAAAAAAAGIELPARGRSRRRASARRSGRVRVGQGPCRFCGTGCGVLVGTKDGRVVATQGDPDAPVNKGLNCIKGYFLSKIMYGKDRLTTPLLRKKDGKYDKNGEFTPVSLERGLRRHGREVQGRAQGQGPDRGRHVRLRPVDDLGRLRRGQAVQGRLPHQQPRPQRAPLHGVGGRRASCAPSASTSRWAATTTSSTPTRSCCGARTWPRCTRSCGRASPTAG